LKKISLLSFTKNIARKIVFPAIMSFHFEKILSSFSEDNKLILVYHGVVDTPNHSISVGPIATAQFKQHLEYYKRNFDVVSQDAIFKMYRDGFKPKRKTIAITFDDGYENNYAIAFPLLRQYNFPATMFIISNCIEDDNMITWYDHLDFVKKDLKPAELHTIRKLTGISDLKNLVKTLNISERAALYTEIEKQVKIEGYKSRLPRNFWKLMNANQLRELSDSGLVEIAAHTHNHPNLGEIKIEDAHFEVTKCKQLLESTLQKEVISIAFPDGSYTDEVKDICSEAGYKNLLAVDYRCPSDKEDKRILPRYCLSSTTTYESNMIQVNRNFSSYGF
jgi:peptidoglycan/xylan/chitin deacetylase (PgdA/CDA1 family)